MKDNKIFLKKKNTKSTNMLVGGIEIFLKKKKKRNGSMVVKDIRIFWKMSTEKIFQNAGNKDYLSIRDCLGLNFFCFFKLGVECVISYCKDYKNIFLGK